MAGLSILQDCNTIQLDRGKNTLVDGIDYHLAKYPWRVQFDGWSFYAKRNVYVGGGAKNRKQASERLHRVILCAPRGVCVDHRDGDSLNNTRGNLRLATGTQNKQNRRKTRGSSRFKGVWAFNKGWQARICAEKVSHHLGTFATEEEAARAYDIAARKLHGEFACTNAELHGEY
jgi:hypothetical protein